MLIQIQTSFVKLLILYAQTTQVKIINGICESLSLSFYFFYDLFHLILWLYLLNARNINILKSHTGTTAPPFMDVTLKIYFNSCNVTNFATLYVRYDCFRKNYYFQIDWRLFYWISHSYIIFKHEHSSVHASITCFFCLARIYPQLAWNIRSLSFLTFQIGQ